MTRPATNATSPEQAEAAKKPKRYRWEFGLKEVVLYGFGLILAGSWLFVFGLLVGRGIPLVGSKTFSWQDRIFRSLGLERPAAQPAPMATDNWTSPEQMTEQLRYYEELTERNTQALLSLKPLSPLPASDRQKPALPHSDADAKHDDQDYEIYQETVPSKKKPPLRIDTAPSEAAPGQFTLLVSSLKDPENANSLVEQLKAKGYSPRLETLNLTGSGKWNRVLIGSFRTREEALRFAAEFNRKERMEGLVIRENP